MKYFNLSIPFKKRHDTNLQQIHTRMNKKQRSIGSVVCFRYVATFLDNLNTVREVSTGFFPKEWTTSVKVSNPCITSRTLKKILTKKPSNIKTLDLSNCMYLNSRCLKELLHHFSSLRYLVLDDCHALVHLPLQLEGVHCSLKNLWRIYHCTDTFTAEETLTIVMNAFNYLCMNCCCHTTTGKVCLRRLKDFCLRDSSLLVYIMDCLLYELSPVEFVINDSFSRGDNEKLLFITCFSPYGTSQKIEITLRKNTRGLWRVSDFWSRR